MTQRIIDKCIGSLIAGAAGDALGYAVEFSQLSSIYNRYGDFGITHYDLSDGGVAHISDDTQMTLFTARGILDATDAGHNDPDSILEAVTDAYLDWLRTQTQPFNPAAPTSDTLMAEPRLWEQRAPGITCLSALNHVATSPRNVPVANNSKGCGGVMRVAPIGIYAATHPQVLSTADAALLAGRAAEITHRHPLSTLASMAMAVIVAECIAVDNIDRNRFSDIALRRTMEILSALCGPSDRNLETLRLLIERALTLAVEADIDTEAIACLGEGWVAEETLAIAIYCVMRYIDNFDKCLACAVNHSGDSDSTGSVAGQIIGAIAGLSAIAPCWTENLELCQLIEATARRLGGAR